MYKFYAPCGCDGIPGMIHDTTSLGCPISLSICNYVKLANIISYKMDKLNRYIDTNKNPKKRKADMDELKRKEREFLALNYAMRDVMLYLKSNQEAWNAVTHNEKFCAIFESVFGWNPKNELHL